MKLLLFILWAIVGCLVMSQNQIAHAQYGLLLFTYLIKLLCDYIREG